MTNEEEKVIETVQVALRIRPLVDSEIDRGCETCLENFPSQAQVQVKGLAFTYNYVFPPEISQCAFYETAISEMVKKLFKGYNVTILAYGQTGSGKTYSMGTCYNGDNETAGIIPRAVNDIFYYIDSNSDKYDFKVNVSFAELYQERLYDLLSNKPREQNVIDIREDHRGIYLQGITEEKVNSAEETMQCLVRGSSGRATGATAMNAHSSRSHAIFTIQIVKENKEDRNQITTSKFHLVDLAGSERSKKTKATGNRFKEGVKINQGLLALGNVISALGDGTNRGFIAYRESKLTRLLSDSLGGNSMTLMVACVSPADYNLEETVSTLRYADRARQIKNKPIINQDAKGAEIIRLNNLVQQLRVQLLNGGPCAAGDGIDLARELEKEKLKNAELSQKYNELAEKNKSLNKMLQESMNENTNIYEKILLAEAAKEKVDRKLNEITEECNQTINDLSKMEDVSQREKALQSICGMRSKILNIQSEQKNDEKELIDQMIQENSINNMKMEIDDEYLEASPLINENDIQCKEEAHALDQFSKGHQLQDLVKSLALKMSLAEKLSAANQGISEHNQNIKEYEEKISSLEQEREKLTQQLKAIGHKNRDQKTVDRVQMLETEINNLKKKCQQQANFLKMKEKNDLRIEQLNREIVQMKAARVKLIKTMKQDNVKFQQWKIQNERRIAKLCNQDRKRQNAMIKMEIMHVKQQNVLKRKMEEAVAINKRLKDALDKHQSAQRQRGTHIVKNGDNKSNNDAILQFVQQEMEVVSWLVAAQRHLDGLMEDRSTFVEQLEERRRCNPNDPHIPQLQEEINQRSAQIAELQEKILTGDQENKAKSRWESVHTMAEAKFALKYLFEATVEAKREIQNFKYKKINEDTNIEEIKNLYSEAVETIDNLTITLQNKEFEHKKEVAEIEKQNEEKICTLLLQLNGSDSGSIDDQLTKRVNILEELYNNAIKSKDSLAQDVESLRKQLEEASKKVQRKKNNNNNVKKSKAEKAANTTYTWDDDEEDDDESSEGDDPDWKATPIARRTFVKTRLPLKDLNNETNVGVKRNSDGQTKCSCKGNCGTKQCSCKKFNITCGGRCKCNKEMCANNKDTSDIENRSQATNSTEEKWEDCDSKSIRYTTDPISESDDSRSLSRQTSAEDNTDNFPKKAKKNRSFFYGEGVSGV